LFQENDNNFLFLLQLNFIEIHSYYRYLFIANLVPYVSKENLKVYNFIGFIFIMVGLFFISRSFKSIDP